jgi:hypothetical protein
VKITAQSVFLITASLVVLAAVAAGFWMIGSPGDARLRRLDSQRVEALVELTRAVDVFTRTHGDVPERSSQLGEQEGISSSTTIDPETGDPYGYRKTGARAYELCARFARVSDTDTSVRWRHGSGRWCFARISPDPANLRSGPFLAPFRMGLSGN